MTSCPAAILDWSTLTSGVPRYSTSVKCPIDALSRALACLSFTGKPHPVRGGLANSEQATHDVASRASKAQPDSLPSGSPRLDDSVTLSCGEWYRDQICITETAAGRPLQRAMAWSTAAAVANAVHAGALDWFLIGPSVRSRRWSTTAGNTSGLRWRSSRGTTRTAPPSPLSKRSDRAHASDTTSVPVHTARHGCDEKSALAGGASGVSWAESAGSLGSGGTAGCGARSEGGRRAAVRSSAAATAGPASTVSSERRRQPGRPARPRSATSHAVFKEYAPSEERYRRVGGIRHRLRGTVRQDRGAEHRRHLVCHANGVRVLVHR